MKKLGIVLSVVLLVAGSSARAADLYDSDLYDAIAPSPPAGVLNDPVDVDFSTDSLADEATTCIGCDSGSDRCGSGDSCKLFGLFVRSESRFNDFISPMTNPAFFEDPRTLTEARFIFINHKFPQGLGSGDLQVYAMQLRAALTDRLSIIATKDGFIVGQPNAPLDDGWADINAGLKYNLYSDECLQRLLSVGATFELPVGSRRTLQGSGNGEFHIFASGAAKLTDHWRWVSGSGFRLPTDTDDRSSMFYWSNHVDRKVFCDNLYFLMETNWYHWMGAGTTGIGVNGLEGGDLFNFGAPGVAGNDIVTGAFGFKLKPSNNIEIGIVAEFPVTDRRDVMDNRITADLILRY